MSKINLSDITQDREFIEKIAELAEALDVMQMPKEVDSDQDDDDDDFVEDDEIWFSEPIGLNPTGGNEAILMPTPFAEWREGDTFQKVSSGRKVYSWEEWLNVRPSEYQSVNKENKMEYKNNNGDAEQFLNMERMEEISKRVDEMPEWKKGGQAVFDAQKSVTQNSAMGEGQPSEPYGIYVNNGIGNYGKPFTEWREGDRFSLVRYWGEIYTWEDWLKEAPFKYQIYPSIKSGVRSKLRAFFTNLPILFNLNMKDYFSVNYRLEILGSIYESCDKGFEYVYYNGEIFPSSYVTEPDLDGLTDYIKDKMRWFSKYCEGNYLAFTTSGVGSVCNILYHFSFLKWDKKRVIDYIYNKEEDNFYLIYNELNDVEGVTNEELALNYFTKKKAGETEIIKITGINRPEQLTESAKDTIRNYSRINAVNYPVSPNHIAFTISGFGDKMRVENLFYFKYWDRARMIDYIYHPESDIFYQIDDQLDLAETENMTKEEILEKYFTRPSTALTEEQLCGGMYADWEKAQEDIVKDGEEVEKGKIYSDYNRIKAILKYFGHLEYKSDDIPAIIQSLCKVVNAVGEERPF